MPLKEPPPTSSPNPKSIKTQRTKSKLEKAMAVSWFLRTISMVVLMGCTKEGNVDAQSPPPKLNASAPPPSPATATALFVFGDSLSDDGNNNYITSLARSNFPPYGIDFPSGPTGRFCNGKIVVDFLGQFLGLPLIPAYLDPLSSGPNIMKGVNYASAAGGILDDTGFNYGSRISFRQQVANFQATVNQLRAQLGGQEAVQKFLAKAIFALEFGSNDYINNYLNPFFFSTARQYSPQNFSDLLISEYNKHLNALYSLGARKMALSAVGPLGCIPQQLAMRSSDGQCVESVNRIVETFNGALKGLVTQLDKALVGATLVYVDNYNSVLDMIRSSASYGFRVVNEGCCGIGRFRGHLTCIMLVRPCVNRSEYVFWDAFHPTEAVNVLLANRAFHGHHSETFPMNLSTLVQI